MPDEPHRNRDAARLFLIFGAIATAILAAYSLYWGLDDRSHPIGAAAEIFAAQLLGAVRTFAPFIAGYYAGRWASQRAGLAAGWVAGIIVAAALAWVFFDLFARIPGVGWRIH